jgi:hypothetical protein
LDFNLSMSHERFTPNFFTHRTFLELLRSPVEISLAIQARLNDNALGTIPGDFGLA